MVKNGSFISPGRELYVSHSLVTVYLPGGRLWYRNGIHLVYTWYSPLPTRLVGFGEWWKMARMTHVRSDVYCVELTLFYLGYRGCMRVPHAAVAVP